MVVNGFPSHRERGLSGLKRKTSAGEERLVLRCSRTFSDDSNKFDSKRAQRSEVGTWWNIWNRRKDSIAFLLSTSRNRAIYC